MHLEPPSLGDADVDHPRVTALARMQAIDGDFCTTLFGGIVRLDGSVIRTLLTLTDGSRDRDQIRAEIARASGTAARTAAARRGVARPGRDGPARTYT